MDELTDRTSVLQHIHLAAEQTLTLYLQDLDLDLTSHVSERAVSESWVQKHAHLSIPEHHLHSRLTGLGAPNDLRTRLIQAFEDSIRALHHNASHRLQQACLDIPSLTPTLEGFSDVERVRLVIESSQSTFERTIRESEEAVISLYQEKRPSVPRTAVHAASDNEPNRPQIKDEYVSDEDMPNAEVDPKPYYHMLEHIFRQGIEKPSRKDKLAFAAQTGLSYDYIRVWFQNRRSRGITGGRCDWRQKRLLKDLGMPDHRFVESIELDGLEPLSASSDDEGLLAAESAAMVDVDLDMNSEYDAEFVMSETEAEFNESEWETDPEDLPDTPTSSLSSFNSIITRVPSLTHSVGTGSTSSRASSSRHSSPELESRASSPKPSYSQKSLSQASILPPAFNYRPARQFRSPSPAPSLHSKSPLLDDDAKLPTLDIPQLNMPFRIGSWRTNNNRKDFSQLLAAMPVPHPQKDRSQSPSSEEDDNELDAPSPADSENIPSTPPTVTASAFPPSVTRSNALHLSNADPRTPKQFVFGASSVFMSKSPVAPTSAASSPAPFTFGISQLTARASPSSVIPFTFGREQTPTNAPNSLSSSPAKPAAPFVFGQQQKPPATPTAPPASPPKFVFGSSASPSSPPSPATPFKFGQLSAVAEATTSPSKFNFSSPASLQSSPSYAAGIRRASAGMVAYQNANGNQASPTIAAARISIPSPTVFDFSNPRQASTSSVEKLSLPPVFSFGQQAQSAPIARPVVGPSLPPLRKVSGNPSTSVTPFLFGNDAAAREPSKTFTFGAPSSAAHAEEQPIASSSKTLSPTTINPTSTGPTLPIARLAGKGKASLVLAPRKPSSLPKHAAAATSRSFSQAIASSQRRVSSSDKGKGKAPAVPVRDFFGLASRRSSALSELDVLADAALGNITEEDVEVGNELDAAASVPLPASPVSRKVTLSSLGDYADSDDAGEDAVDADDEDDDAPMTNALPPTKPSTFASISPPASAFDFSFPSSVSFTTARNAAQTPTITDDIRRRAASFTQNYLSNLGTGFHFRPMATSSSRS